MKTYVLASFRDFVESLHSLWPDVPTWLIAVCVVGVAYLSLKLFR